eukprot:1171226-Karenia_brevis.AAC.1
MSGAGNASHHEDNIYQHQCKRCLCALFSKLAESCERRNIAFPAPLPSMLQILIHTKRPSPANKN